MNDWTLRTAEFVLPGHPDKLADAIADAIVETARNLERRALVGVEVALHRNVVFIDGRVACDGAEDIDFEKIAKDVYAEVGYGPEFPPEPESIQVITDLCLGPLREGEAEFREVSDDQSIVTGYACSTPGTNYLPVEHALVGRLARALDSLRRSRPELLLGPDGKLIVFVEESSDARQFRMESVSVSIQHASEWDAIEARRAIDQIIRSEIADFSINVPGFSIENEFRLHINCAGDFVEGGPYGDNGLTGKKLVMDFYGPRVPIGGGAMSGKDFWKVDRAGALIARKLAVYGVEKLGLRECFVTLGIRPGDRKCRIVNLRSDERQSIDASEFNGLVDLSLRSFADWSGNHERLVDIARFGHFRSPAFGKFGIRWETIRNKDSI